MEKKAQEKSKQRKRSFFFEVREKRVSQKFKKIFSHKEFDKKKHRDTEKTKKRKFKKGEKVKETRKQEETKIRTGGKRMNKKRK